MNKKKTFVTPEVIEKQLEFAGIICTSAPAETRAQVETYSEGSTETWF